MLLSHPSERVNVKVKVKVENSYDEDPESHLAVLFVCFLATKKTKRLL